MSGVSAPNPSTGYRIAAIAVVVVAAGFSIFFGFSVKRPALAIATQTFTIFAGLFVATQAVERFTELCVAPWIGGASADGQERADKAILTGAIATLIGVVISGTVGLYLIHSISQGSFGRGGDNVARTFDVLVTGLAIGGGTKPLHDLISRIQASKERAQQAAP